MDKAAEKAREGDLAYFETLSPEELTRLCKRKDEDQRSLLHNAVTSGNLELCQLLVTRGGSAAVVDDQDEEGWTPLQSAASCGFEAVVDLLLALGADVQAANSGGRTALHYAASKGRAGVLRQLLKAGARAGAADSTGSTALHRAASAGKAEAVAVLVEQGRAALDPQDKQGCTPLFIAVQVDAAQVAFYLASKGAGLEVANKDGETPLSIAGENAPALKSAAAQRGGMEVD
ncbi:hypothetical protein HXX76_013555 [Chlamydomonas incerta]|uniref:26S proteasome non-ATPase regulatory subunit 10 n=1 Tax=Chlamydomonas incerta TaxID=51695 RepID=A0A835VTX0_CHLIN|nr:hypothetical protein HXX76_013555 [Chlamydomonas incerta]|eukprot:KAG2425713.1 hypothetical protein HXX76_013555 [Chlamydomonas incerta]